MILSQSMGISKMALGIVEYFYDRPSQPIGVIWFAVSFLRSIAVDPLTTDYVGGLTILTGKSAWLVYTKLSKTLRKIEFVESIEIKRLDLTA